MVASLLLVSAQGTPAQALLLGALVPWLVDRSTPGRVRSFVAVLLFGLPWVTLLALSREQVEHPIQFLILPVAAMPQRVADYFDGIRRSSQDATAIDGVIDAGGGNA